MEQKIPFFGFAYFEDTKMLSEEGPIVVLPILRFVSMAFLSFLMQVFFKLIWSHDLDQLLVRLDPFLGHLGLYSEIILHL